MVQGRFTGKQKIVMATCCILLLVSGILVYAGYLKQADEKKHYIQLHLKKVAGRMAGQINGDGLESLQPGDEGSPRYLAFAKALYEGRRNDSFITTAYLLKNDNGTIRYVVHDEYLVHGLDASVVRIGETATEDRDVILNAAIQGPQYSPTIYTSKWGSFLSGYAPVRDSSGKVVGILGVDETAEMIFSYETDEFYSLIEAT